MPRAPRDWIIPAMLTVGVALAQFFTMDPWSASVPTRVAWLPGALLLGTLLVSPTSRWGVLFLAALAGSTVACLGMGRMILPHCVLIAGELALVAGAAAWLQRVSPRERSERDGCDPTYFLLVGGIVLPLAGVAWQFVVAHQFDIAMLHPTWTEAALARSLAYLVIVPACFAAADALRAKTVPIDGRRAGIAMLCMTVLLLVWLSPIAAAGVAPLLVIAPLVLLLWIAHALGTAWTRMGWVAVCMACVWISAAGAGPWAHDGRAATLAHLQWWAIGSSVAILLFTSLQDNRARAHAALDASLDEFGRLARRLMTVQENERSRIARDLHDDVSQSLASLSIELSALKRQVDPVAGARIDALQDRLLGSSEDIRRMSHELHPSMLRYTSLGASLQALCASHSSERLAVRCETDESFDLHEPQKLELFRIAQEALSNAEKHAAASRVDIALRRDGDRVLLRIEDDGRGLPADPADMRGSGLGMISMDERARTLRGELVFSRGSRGGTRVEVRFPVAAP